MLSINCNANESKLSDDQIKQLDVFLGRLYQEIKCPTYPLADYKKLGVTVCIHSLSYDLDKRNILFAYTAYKSNKYLENFDKTDQKGRKQQLYNLLSYLASYTGVSTIFPNSEVYSGKIQTTSINRVYTIDSLKANQWLHEFVKDNSVIGVRVVEGHKMKYVAYQDADGKKHYSEAPKASILQFMK